MKMYLANLTCTCCNQTIPGKLTYQNYMVIFLANQRMRWTLILLNKRFYQTSGFNKQAILMNKLFRYTNVQLENEDTEIK